MSFLSTLQSMFRTPKPRGTIYTISVFWDDGSVAFDYPISLPDHVANMLEAGKVPEHAVIWKSSEPPSDTGIEKRVLWRRYQVSCSPANEKPATDGLPEQKLQPSLTRDEEYRIWRASYYSGSTPAVDPRSS